MDLSNSTSRCSTSQAATIVLTGYENNANSNFSSGSTSILSGSQSLQQRAHFYVPTAPFIDNPANCYQNEPQTYNQLNYVSKENLQNNTLKDSSIVVYQQTSVNVDAQAQKLLERLQPLSTSTQEFNNQGTY